MKKIINNVNQETIIDNVTDVTFYEGGIIVDYMGMNEPLPNQPIDDTLYPQRTFINADNYQYVQVIN